MTDLSIDLVVSSWPFRLGTIVYDPLLRIDVATWEPLDQRVKVPDDLTNPTLPYAERATQIVSFLNQTQAHLRRAYEVSAEEGLSVVAVRSDLVPESSDRVLSEHGLSFDDVQIPRLAELMAKLDALPAEDHHAFLADWWETFELPLDVDRPSAFRTKSGPDGAIYGSGADALDRWRSDVASTLGSGFSLWNVLRAHWARRIEFPSEALTPEDFPDLAAVLSPSAV